MQIPNIKRRKVTDEKLEKARQLYLIDGLSWRAIAPLVGLSEATLRRNLDCSRDLSEAGENAWRRGLFPPVSAETRAKLSEVSKRMWAKTTDRGWLNRKRWEYWRLMNA